MQLGKTLVGAIIGAAIGVGLLAGAFLIFGWDGFWLAIPFAIVTGLGVRAIATTRGHASYARGALTCVLALAAYLGGIRVVAMMAQARAASLTQQSEAKAKSERGAGEAVDGNDNAAGPDAVPPVNQMLPVAQTHADPGHRPLMPRQYPVVDILSLAIAALAAYELGRGTGVPVDAGQTVPPSAPPAGTHPDA